MQTKKTYAPGSVKVKKFPDGTSFLNYYVKKEVLRKFLDTIPDGVEFNINFTKRKEPSQYGDTHSAVLNTWVPEKKMSQNSTDNSQDDF